MQGFHAVAVTAEIAADAVFAVLSSAPPPPPEFTTVASAATTADSSYTLQRLDLNTGAIVWSVDVPNATVKGMATRGGGGVVVAGQNGSGQAFARAYSGVDGRSVWAYSGAEGGSQVASVSLTNGSAFPVIVGSRPAKGEEPTFGITVVALRTLRSVGACPIAATAAASPMPAHRQ